MTRSEEKDILMDHDYDGIQELDNDLPPWWLWLFYISIIWGVIYLIHFHVLETGDSSAVEYLIEMNPDYVAANVTGDLAIGYRSPFYGSGEDLTPLTRVQLALAREKEAMFLAAQQGGGEVDISMEDISFEEIIHAAMDVAGEENMAKLQTTFPEIWESYQGRGKLADAVIQTEVEDTVEPLTAASDLTAGESIFITNCVSCHGKFGEGGIGPNMTDNYFIHGHTLNNMISTINNGIPAKGMISWKPILNDDQILQVASYILTLRGTEPPNPKAPQGEKVELSVQ